jgi:hypothetical protein
MLPRVPVRHWTLSLPRELRGELQGNDALTARVARQFAQEIFALIRARLQPEHGDALQCGAATLVHRLGAALNLNVHVHVLALDGAYTVDDGTMTFHPLPEPPTEAMVAQVVARVCDKLRQWLGPPVGERPAPHSPPPVRAVREASVRHRIASGPAVRRVSPAPVPLAPEGRPGIHAEREGLQVFAASAIDASDRRARLNLSRYVARAPIALERLERSEQGRIRYRLAHPFADGTTHVELDPNELAERLAAAVPDGPVGRVVYHGVLAPRAAQRWRVVPTQLVLVEGRRAPKPTPPRPPTSRPPPSPRAHPPSLPPPSSPADPLQCEQCGAQMEIVGVEETDERGLVETPPTPPRR